MGPHGKGLPASAQVPIRRGPGPQLFFVAEGDLHGREDKAQVGACQRRWAA